jgi:hypothetical protein
VSISEEATTIKIPDFELERWKTKRVLPGIIDLTETGLPEPLKVRDLITEQHLDVPLDYAPDTRVLWSTFL